MGLGLSGNVWYDKSNGLYRWATTVWSARDSCIVNAAGALAGGFDSDADMGDVRRECRQNKLDFAEICRIARPYANAGRRLGAGRPEAPPKSGPRVRGSSGRSNNKQKTAKPDKPAKRGWLYWE